MLNKYVALPTGLAGALLTKDGRVISPHGSVLSRGEINGKNFYMVESLGEKKIFKSERTAILEFIFNHETPNGSESDRSEEEPEGHGQGGIGGLGASGLGKKKKRKNKKKPKETEGIFSKINSDTVDRSNLEMAMDRKDMTVTELAGLANVDPSTVSRNLRKPRVSSGGADPGGRNPSISLAADISQILGIPIETGFPDLFRKGSKRKKRKGNVKSGRSSHFKSKGKLEESIDRLAEDLYETDALISEGITAIIMARPDLHIMILEALKNLKSNSGPAQIRLAMFNHFLENKRYIKPARARSLSESFQRRLYASKINAVQSFRNLFLDHFVPCVGMLKSILSKGVSIISEEAIPSATTGAVPPTMAGAAQKNPAEASAVDPKSQSATAVAGEDIASSEDDSPEQLMKDIEKADEGQQEERNAEREQAVSTLEQLQDIATGVQDDIEDNIEANDKYQEGSNKEIEQLALGIEKLRDEGPFQQQ
jgi:transcriptional regulator with XRE-family HTH domain